MKVRACQGLTVETINGSFEWNAGNMECAAVDADSAYAVRLVHDGKLDPRRPAVIQAALLYTTSAGQRRIRVHNMAVEPTDQVATIFAKADLEAIVTLLTRQAVQKVVSGETQMGSVRSGLVEDCAAMLWSWRKYCSQNPPAGQLVLPKAMQLYPVLLLGLIKNVMLRKGSDVNLDERIWMIRTTLSAGAGFLSKLLYPRLYDITDLSDSTPLLLRLQTSSISPTRAYLLNDGQYLHIWLGEKVPPGWQAQVFGQEDLTALRLPDMHRAFRPYDNDTSRRLHGLLAQCRPRNSPLMPGLLITRQKEPLERRFLSLLIEDKGTENTNYQDMLVLLYKRVSEKQS